MENGNQTPSKRKGTLTALLVAAALVATAAYFVAPFKGSKADTSVAAKIIQKEQATAQTNQIIIAGLLAAAATNEQFLMVVMFSQLQAAASIIQSAIKDAETTCSSNAPECLYALGYIKMSLAMNGLPQSKEDEKKLVSEYSAAYEKFASAKAQAKGK
jgi:hypothetical protein